MNLMVFKWAARVLAILSILVMLIFSFDAFGGDASTGNKLAGFLLHNIPTFALIIALVVAWKYEIAGGILFILAFIGLGIFFKSFTQNLTSLYLISPLLIAGILFISYKLLLSKRAV